MTADIHFSPLALTHALPFLPLAQGDIDYQVDRRSEPGLIDELLAEPTTKVVLRAADLSPYRAAKASLWTMRT